MATTHACCVTPYFPRRRRVYGCVKSHVSLHAHPQALVTRLHTIERVVGIGAGSHGHDSIVDRLDSLASSFKIFVNNIQGFDDEEEAEASLFGGDAPKSRSSVSHSAV